MGAQHQHNGSSTRLGGWRLPGRRKRSVSTPSYTPPPYVPPLMPPIQTPDLSYPAPSMQTVVYVQQRLWRPVWAACLAIVIGNLLVHLYCQDWHLAAPGRGASEATIFAAVTAVFFVVVCWREYWSRHWDTVGIVLPSVIGGVLAIIAWLAGMPGPASWIPPYDNLLAFFREGELFFVPLTTLAQLWLLARVYLVPDHIPF